VGKAVAEAKLKAAQAKADAKMAAEAEAKKQAAAEAKAEAAALAKAEAAAKAKAEAAAKKEAEAKRMAELAAEEKAKLEATEKAEAAAQAAASNAAEIEKYKGLIKAKVKRTWVAPPGSSGSSCNVRIRLSSDGTVMDSTVNCNGNDIFSRSVENAIERASPLPVPSDRALLKEFRAISFTFNAN